MRKKNMFFLFEQEKLDNRQQENRGNLQQKNRVPRFLKQHFISV
jgi:hypothetical protein